jgi:hypothetical protein
MPVTIDVFTLKNSCGAVAKVITYGATLHERAHSMPMSWATGIGNLQRIQP